MKKVYIEVMGCQMNKSDAERMYGMLEHLGYTVQKLDRVYYAGITKKNLKRGQWRFLTREEVERLKSGRYE